MRQLTPQSWGLVYWGGGAGKPGEMGGWRVRCNFCDVGNGLKAFPRKLAADTFLSNHCMERHSHKTEVAALAKAQSTTGAAECDGLIDGRSVSGVKLRQSEAAIKWFSRPIECNLCKGKGIFCSRCGRGNGTNVQEA